MADFDDMRTTRWTPQSLAARRTLSVPFSAGSSSSFCDRAVRNRHDEIGGVVIYETAERSCRKNYCLRILCLQRQRGRQVEDAARALDRRPHGGGSVEEVHLEQPEPRVRAVQGLQVLRLALVLCENEQTEHACKSRFVFIMSRVRVQLCK